MYQDSNRTCTAIVLLIKSFVWCCSRRRRRRGLLKLPNVKHNRIKINRGSINLGLCDSRDYSYVLCLSFTHSTNKLNFDVYEVRKIAVYW